MFNLTFSKDKTQMQNLGIPMRNDIHELVDFDKLKRCNDIGIKWTSRFNFSRRKHVHFMHDLMKDHEKYKNILPVKYRSQFAKDLKIMFYAASIENVLCEQYTFMVLGIIKKFNIIKEEDIEDFFSEGCLAIKFATWHYRNHKSKANFTTFVHHAIFLRIRNKKQKAAEKKARRIKFIQVSNETDCNASIDILPSKGSIDDEYQEFTVQDIIKMSKLTEKEEFIINCYINRSINTLWYEEFRKKYKNEQLQKEYSRQSVYMQLIAVQNKIVDFMKNKKLVDQNFKLERKVAY